MKSNPIIYTDEDVRPDLLTAEERAKFPQTLDNVDRREILRITRSRIDNIDFNGHHILPPKAWRILYEDCIHRGTDVNTIPELVPTISREVVLPQNGEVRKVDAGIADVVQRLMDRGLVIDTAASYSGMVTDHPGERWVSEEPHQGLTGWQEPGEHINAGFDGEGLKLVFPKDTHKKFYNDAENVELIERSAIQSGLVVEKLPDYIEVQMPFLMDGTSRRDFIKEARGHAQAYFTGEGAYREWTQVMHVAKNLVAMNMNHGGPAVFSDQMIQDRLSRFVRTLERSLIENRRMERKEQEQVYYGDFLTSNQKQDVYKQSEEFEQTLWKQRALPYIYDKYKEPRYMVDEVARTAGYRDYVHYMTDRSRNTADNKRWAAFQQLGKHYLTNDHEGTLKNFRINNGIKNEVRNFVREVERRMAAEVLDRYKSYGYPTNRIRDIHILMNDDGTAKVWVNHRGKDMMKVVGNNEIARLMMNATTPFELALTAFTKEIGWPGRPNINISEETARKLNLDTRNNTGWMPLSTPGHVYHVSDIVWDGAYTLTRFEQMPDWLQQRVLDSHPAVTRASALQIGELRQRMDSLEKQINDAISDVKAVKTDEKGLVIHCRVNGSPAGDIKLSFEELDFSRTFLPGMQMDTPLKQQLAGYLQQDIFRDNTRSMKR